MSGRNCGLTASDADRTATAQAMDRWFERASAHFGPMHWWPGDTPLEVCVGAILTQNTNWSNVERAIAALKAAGAMDLATLHALPQDDLAALIRPAGYFNVKAKRLKNFVRLVSEQFGGDLNRLWALGLPEAREVLLAVSGVGKETADSMLLYAGGLPIFVVDAYTRRILARHGHCAPDADYDALQAFMTQHVRPADTARFNEFHALIVAVGKHHCRPRDPRCDTCPWGEDFEGPDLSGGLPHRTRKR